MSEIQKDQLYSKDVLRRNSEGGTEVIHYHVLYTEVPEEYERLAIEELNETDENKEKGLRKLKSFIQRKNVSCTDNELLSVLRCCKYNLSKAETKLKTYLRCSKFFAEKLRQVGEDKIKFILDDMAFSVLPYRDANGRAVFVTKPSLNLDAYSMNDVEPVAFASFLFLQSFPLTTICGFSYIMECKCDSLWIFYPVIKAFKNNVKNILELPYRFGQCDILNENFLLRIAYHVVRPFIPEKLYKRIFFSGHTYENLHKVYHPDLLPQEFDGNLPPMNNKFYREQLLNFIKEFTEKNQ